MRVPLLQGPADDAVFVVVDTETTGLHVTDRPIEIGAVRLEAGREVATFETLVSPDGPIPASSTKIHGLTDADLAGAPTPAEVLPALAEFGRDAVWVAHNSGFDAGILGMAYLRAGLPAPTEPVLDSCRLARACIPGLGSYRLDNVAQHIGVDGAGAHRALADARVAAAVLLRCVKAIGARPPMEEVARRAGGWLSISGVAAAASDVPGGFEPLQQAVVEGAKVRLQYRAGGKDPPVGRTVAPKVLYRRGDRTYMEAFCFDGRYVKSYRLDRIAAFEVLRPAR